MRRARALLVVPLLVSLQGCAPKAPQDAFLGRADRRAPHTLDVGNAFLWQVTRAGSDEGRLYLLGSVHVLDAPLALGPRLEPLFAASEELLMEIDPRDLSPQRLLDTASYFGRFAPAESLRDHLDEKSRRRLERFCRIHPPPPRMISDLDETQPWLLELWVSNVVAEAAGMGPGADLQLWMLAVDRMTVTSLESIEGQLEAIASVPLDEQAADLAELLRAWDENDPDPREEVRRLVAAWKAGDDDGIVPDLALETGQAERLLHRRNQEMSEQLGARVERGGTRFAVVGVAHLVGEHSVVELLAERGYRVERLR